MAMSRQKSSILTITCAIQKLSLHARSSVTFVHEQYAAGKRCFIFRSAVRPLINETSKFKPQSATRHYIRQRKAIYFQVAVVAAPLSVLLHSHNYEQDLMHSLSISTYLKLNLPTGPIYMSWDMLLCLFSRHAVRMIWKKYLFAMH